MTWIWGIYLCETLGESLDDGCVESVLLVVVKVVYICW